jgi:hypothetical protein
MDGGSEQRYGRSEMRIWLQIHKLPRSLLACENTVRVDFESFSTTWMGKAHIDCTRKTIFSTFLSEFLSPR